MKILYGVQGTGNGHLTRARAMARALARYPQVQVDWLFSGRERGDFFDMECFGAWQWRRGLSFATRAGRVRPLATLRQLSPGEFLRDMRELDLDGYDRVVSDFEPVTAWAARRQRRDCIGLGHQYALVPGVPRSRRNLVGSLVLRACAPVGTRIGLHWHHFGHPLLPPIVDADARPAGGAARASPREALVYLPFEDPERVIALLRAIPGWRFAMFGPGLVGEQRGNVATHPVGRATFVAALERASHIVCNCGFELISEALCHGKRILAKPLAGQMEQVSNALALQALGFARIARQLDPQVIGDFLALETTPPRSDWPDVAAAIAAWLVEGGEPLEAVSERLWRECGMAGPRGCADATGGQEALRAPA